MKLKVQHRTILMITSLQIRWRNSVDLKWIKDEYLKPEYVWCATACLSGAVAAFLGTTLPAGAVINFFTTYLWWYVIYRFRMLGFVPTNMVWTIVSFWNVYYAFSH